MMDTKSFFELWNRLRNIFLDVMDVTRKISGKWQLYEYFTEPEKELQHFNQKNLKENGHFLNVEFLPDKMLNLQSNLPLIFFAAHGFCRWSRHRNFITLIRSDDATENIELQFAVTQNQLKLLKKDNKGRILFFGFFKRTEAKI